MREESQAENGLRTSKASKMEARSHPMPEETARIVLTTADTADLANGIARTLVERRLAACVNLIPNLTSIYRWQGEIETASETMLLIKTSTASLAALEAALRELHSYEVPEFLVFTIESGSRLYLDWLHASLGA
jgi:periplasmic divalent cation tolerance protein